MKQLPNIKDELSVLSTQFDILLSEYNEKVGDNKELADEYSSLKNDIESTKGTVVRGINGELNFAVTSNNIKNIKDKAKLLRAYIVAI